VAALGLTIPGTSMIESWVASSQNWMNARFADWDTRNPPSADYVIVSDYYDSARFSSHPDSTWLPELKLVSENVATRGVRHTSSPPSVSAKVALALGDARFSPVRRVSLTSRRIDFQPIDITVGWHRGIALELNRRHEGTGIHAPGEVALTAVSTLFKPLAILEPLRTVADELNRQNEGIGILPPERFGPKVIAGPRFEPIPIPDLFEVGIAFELNRCSEGIGTSAVPTATSAKAGTSNSRTDSEVPSLSFATLERDPHLYFAGELVGSTDAGANKHGIDSQIAPQEDMSFAPVDIATGASISPPSGSLLPDSVAVRGTNENLEELEIEVAGELVPEEDGFGRAGQRSLWLENRAEAADLMRPFDPRVADNLSTLVNELNRQNDGLELSATKSSTPAPSIASSSPPSPSLSRAVELTRDAVYAWVNVLTGPALVTVTSSR